jgi:S-adenosylmethionine-dependent methyltransferase
VPLVIQSCCFVQRVENGCSRRFEKKIAFFKEHQNTPWSRLRYNITSANLKHHINSKALTILDAGSGNGLEAIVLAQQGHRVVLLDYSAEMLAEARTNTQNSRLVEGIEFYEGDVCSIPQLFPKTTFDVVLCHNVLQYVDNLDTALQALSHAVKPQGFISIICVNRYSESYRLALQELNLPAAYAALDTNVIVSKVFDVPMKAYAAEDLRAPLQKMGCSIVAQYGIRCVNDYIPNNDIKNDPVFFAEIEKLEYAMSDKFPYYLVARSFHIVAQKVTLPRFRDLRRRRAILSAGLALKGSRNLGRKG